MRNYLEILKQKAAQSKEPLNILEIGCIRSVEPGYDEGDGHSTYHIAKWITDNDLPHKFTSIDKNIVVCHSFLKEKGYRDAVKLIQTESIDYLANTKEKYDYIYLDSENDAQKILDQFILCQYACKDGGVIVVDDCDFGSNIKVKGNLLIPYLRENRIKHDIQGIQVTVYNGMIHDYSDDIQGWYDFHEIYADMVAKYPNGHFVEVGSWLGKSSVSMATMIQNAGGKITFDCVDIWQKQSSADGYPQHEKPYDIFIKNIETVKDYINVVRKPSVEASKQYADNSLDFVFIDASHKYQDVCDDIEAWLPKVKRGGVLAGHDWGCVDVNKAVTEKLTNIKICGNSWYMYKPMIYDCFTYFNESDLLEIRLNELKDVIDVFVIVEANETFSGNPKPYNFDMSLVDKYNIIYITIGLPNDTAWERETYQRNAIINGLKDANDNDYIIISDVDEIPRASAIKAFRKDAARLSMKQYRWKYNNFESDGWKMPVIIRKKVAEQLSPQICRTDFWSDVLDNAGWHFTCVTDVDGIILKFNSFSHTEMQVVANKEYVEKLLQENNSNGAREVVLTPVPLDDTFPAYLVDNKERFKEYIV